jgi:transcriptional regulator with XRE-family HTH domain
VAPQDDVLARFGERVREVRASKEVSQERLSELAGLHRTYVSLIERGERNVTLRTIASIAGALEVEMAELMPAGTPTKRSR